MLPFRYRISVFFLFFLLFCSTEIMSVHCDEAFIWRTVQHRNRVSLISIFCAIPLGIIESRSRRPVAVIRFRGLTDDLSRVLRGHEMRETHKRWYYPQNIPEWFAQGSAPVVILQMQRSDAIWSKIQCLVASKSAPSAFTDHGRLITSH